MSTGNQPQQPKGLAAIMERYTSDPGFKQQLKQDPEEALRRAGIQLDAEDRQMFQQLDWSLPDEQLQQRVSKTVVRFK